MKKVIYILSAILVTSLWSCSTVKYVPVEVVKSDSIYFNKLQRDSILVHDSIFIRERNDTIFEYKYKYVYRDRLLQDTMYVSKIDSIQVPYPIEKSLSKWEKIKMEVGGYALVVLFFAVLFFLGRFALRLK